MKILHHEEASLYGRGVVLHPLAGRPEFKGVIDSATGPTAVIEDGDFVLRVHDVPTLIRWREQLNIAAEQLAKHCERLAAHKAGGQA